MFKMDMGNQLLMALGISVLINLFMFVIAFKKQSDHYTDITYALTFILIAIGVLVINGHYTLMHIVLVVMIGFWGIRLGGYLRRRIKLIGVDHRFDVMRPNWKRYLRFWMIQAVSIWIVAIPYIIGLSKPSLVAASDLGAVFQGLGLGLWAIGFAIETISDHQKFMFRSDPKNDGKFMNEGMFKNNRHPNYLGEIMCWWGVFHFVLPMLSGYEYLSVVSPLWIMFLLLGLSGIPMLEKSMIKRYGNQKEFQEYMKNTYKLIPYIY